MMNCIAIDDEPLALNVIKEFSKRMDSVNMVGAFTNAVDAVSLVIKNNIDLIFLDVEMPGLSGLDFIKSIPNPPLVVLTSAYPKYAINGFEINAVDYLLKPIAFDKFLKAVTKASIELSVKGRHAENRNTEEESMSVQTSNNLDEHIFIKVDYSIVKVRYDEIKLIEGLKDYIKIYVNDKIQITKSTIKNMESKLPKDLFARVHKSFIISINKIDKIEFNHIFIAQKKIPIGMQYKDAFYKIIDPSRL